MNRYTLKVYPKGMGKEAYRVFEIGGRESLDQLCWAILEMFDFDSDHLYEYCMDNRMYGSRDVWSPKSRDQPTSFWLDQLGLYKGQNFSLHYDFGDDWMFVIHVQKVEKVDGKVPLRLLKTKGEVSQYGEEEDWDDWEEEE